MATKSRTPPAEIRRQLRREVGFVCGNCGGSPYLEYHHFDPKWEPAHVHNVSGMIALCSACHRAADSGAISDDDLRERKRSISPPNVQASFFWRHENVIFRVGSHEFMSCQTAIRIHGQDIVYFSEDSAGKKMLNLNLYDSCGNKIVEMRDNDWTIVSPAEDIECGSMQSDLTVRSEKNDLFLKLKFHRAKDNDVDLHWLEKMPDPSKAVICSIQFKFSYPLRMSAFEKSIEIVDFDGRKSVLQLDKIFGAECGIDIS